MLLDLGEVGADVLRDKVRDVLASRPFAQILEARGIAIDRASTPAQTETTQRWTFALRLTNASATLPTKIECSRRGRSRRRPGPRGWSAQRPATAPDLIRDATTPAAETSTAA